MKDRNDADYVERLNRVRSVLNERNEANVSLASPPSVVLFDLCGTLIDSMIYDGKALDAVFKYYGKPDIRYMMKHFKDINKSMKENFPNFFDAKDVRPAYDMYFSKLLEYAEHFELHQGAEELIPYLKQKGIKTGVISNRDVDYVKRLVVNQRFSKLALSLDFTLCANEIGVYKPNPKILDAALLRLNAYDIPKQEVMFVGDSVADAKLSISWGCVPMVVVKSVTDLNVDLLKQFMPQIKLAGDLLEVKSMIEASFMNIQPYHNGDASGPIHPKQKAWLLPCATATIPSIKYE